MEGMENIRKTLRLNLRRLREAKGWNQDALAEKAGVSGGTIKTIETGTNWISPEMAEKIADAFGVESSELFKSEVKEVSDIKKALNSIPSEVYALASEISEDSLAWEVIIKLLRQEAGRVPKRSPRLYRSKA